MKRSLSLLLILFSVGSFGTLAACSNPNAESDSAAVSDAADSEASADETSSESVALNDQQQAYVDEVKTELESFEQSISDLEAKDPQPEGLRRMRKRYEAAQAAVTDLESGAMPWREARREVNRAMKRLNRISEKVQTN